MNQLSKIITVLIPDNSFTFYYFIALTEEGYNFLKKQQQFYMMRKRGDN